MAAFGPRRLGFAYDISEAADRGGNGVEEIPSSGSGFKLAEVGLERAFLFGGACGELVNARRDPVEAPGCIPSARRGLDGHSVTP
jgi:hypothetical protein